VEMVPEELPVFQAAEIERRASAYLLQKLGYDPAIPIDIDFLVESGEKLDLEDYPGLRANYGIEGGVWKDLETGSLKIYVDDGLMGDESPSGWARYRMTVAEELAHIKLHREIIDAMKTAADFRVLHTHPQWQEVERNAKRFAAAILIPARRLMPQARESYRSIVRVAGTSNRDAVKKWMCKALADRFQVSQTAMNLRLSEYPVRVYKHVDEALDDGLEEMP
jgi:hypothetical protein